MTHPVLERLWLGCGALFGAQGKPLMGRLTLHSRGDIGGLADEVLELLAGQWPTELGVLCLSPTHEGLLSDLLDRDRPAHLVLEVPAFLAADPAWVTRLAARAAAGQSLALKGRPLGTLPPALAGCFRHVVIEVTEDRRLSAEAPEGMSRSTPWVLSGTTTPTQAGDGLRRGAKAVLGWPLGDAPDANAPRKEVPASVQVVMDLIQRVDKEEPMERLEEVIRTDPTLAFRLMRLINSPAFGLSVEVSSFQHAIMILGYSRLKRWLALLLTNAVDDTDLKPLMHIAVRRGLLMEEILRAQGDSSGANEAFICGVFSLLDRMLAQPFDRLLGNLPVSEGVAQTLGASGGPYTPLLNLARAVGAELPLDIEQSAEQALLSPKEVNQAALKSLVTSWHMQTD